MTSIDEIMGAIDLTQFEGHTAGPWRVGADLRYVVLGAGRLSRNGMAISVCKLSENSGIKIAEHMPNASLMAAAPDLLAEVIRLRAALADARRDADRMERALKFIQTWAEAYPLESFPEPHRLEWQQAAAALSEKGISIGSLSASNMRHVINGVKRVVDHGLTGNDPGAIGPQWTPEQVADHVEHVLAMVSPQHVPFEAEPPRCPECGQAGWHKLSCSQRTDRAPQYPATRDAGGVVTVCQRPCRCGGCADSACPGGRDGEVA